jgi:hypothetical protein
VVPNVLKVAVKVPAGSRLAPTAVLEEFVARWIVVPVIWMVSCTIPTTCEIPPGKPLM